MFALSLRRTTKSQPNESQLMLVYKVFRWSGNGGGWKHCGVGSGWTWIPLGRHLRSIIIFPVLNAVCDVFLCVGLKQKKPILGCHLLSTSLYLALFHFSYSLTNIQQKSTPSTDTVWVSLLRTGFQLQSHLLLAHFAISAHAPCCFVCGFHSSAS